MNLASIWLLSASSLAAGTPTLEITKTAPSPYVLQGSIITYRVIYRNLDPSPPVPAPKVDVVWLVDSSISMGPYQANLAANAPSFYDSLVGTDFRLAVVNIDVSNTSPRSRPVNTNLSLGVPSSGTGQWTTIGSVFSNMVQVGTSGDPLEYGLTALRETLNHYSFRAGAQKIFVLVTDEADVDPFLDILGTAATLNAAGAKAYAITNPAFAMYCGVGSVTDLANGSCGNINNADWTGTLNAIAQDVLAGLGTYRLRDFLPTVETSYLSSSPSGTLSGSQLDWNLGTIGPGVNRTVTIRSLVTASSGPIVNTALLFEPGVITLSSAVTVYVVTASHTPTITWTATRSNTLTHSATRTHSATWTPTSTVTPTPTVHPRLELTKVSSSPLVGPGEAFRYTLSYRNIGNVDAWSAVLTDTLPAGTIFISSGGNSGGVVSTTILGTGETRLDWTLGIVSAGASDRLEISVQAPLISGVTILSNYLSASFDNSAMPPPLNPAMRTTIGPIDVLVVVPDKFELDRNAINTTQGQTLGIRVTSSQAGSARILIYNSAGEMVCRLLDATFPSPQAWTGSWDGRNAAGDLLASGVYLIHFAGPVQVQTRRIAVLR